MVARCISSPLSRVVLSLFFFSGLGDRPCLLSFPTRRSSDLEPEFEAAHGLMQQHAETIGSFQSARARGLRSEEHTSELQSRPHLVCRLLLEKKKKTPARNGRRTSRPSPRGRQTR